VLSRRNLSYPSCRSTPNSRRFNRLQPLYALFPTPVLCFQQLAASFPKTPGWGGTLRHLSDLCVSLPCLPRASRGASKVFRPRRSLCCAFSRLRARNPFASYHIPANPAISSNYALFCATALRYPLCFQELPHSFYRHGGDPLLTNPGLSSLANRHAAPLSTTLHSLS